LLGVLRDRAQATKYGSSQVIAAMSYKSYYEGKRLNDGHIKVTVSVTAGHNKLQGSQYGYKFLILQETKWAVFAQNTA
jgi:hypothetical protein